MDEPDPDDRQDWSAALAGDGRGYQRIFARHVARVRRHARSLTDSAADAEDVVAVAFFEAWRHRDRIRFVDGSLLPWLLATTTNVARNLGRTSRRYAAALDRLPRPSIAESGAAGAHSGGLGAGGLGAGGLGGSEAAHAIRMLPLRERQVAVLCLVEGFSEREAAEALGIRPGTVKSRLSRARSALRTALRGPEPPGAVRAERRPDRHDANRPERGRTEEISDGI